MHYEDPSKGIRGHVRSSLKRRVLVKRQEATFCLCFYFPFTPLSNEQQKCIEAAHLKVRSFQALIPRIKWKGTMAGQCSAVGLVVNEV